jgi:hypothetical protein
MSAANAQELRALLDYVNQFHHDENAAYATELINDAGLTDFTRTDALVHPPSLTLRPPDGVNGYNSAKVYRCTVQIPACVTTCATARVEPEVNGSARPST